MGRKARNKLGATALSAVVAGSLIGVGVARHGQRVVNRVVHLLDERVGHVRDSRNRQGVRCCQPGLQSRWYVHRQVRRVPAQGHRGAKDQDPARPWS